MKLRGSAVDSGTLLERWCRACPELEDVKYTEIYVPIGPWEKGETNAESNFNVSSEYFFDRSNPRGVAKERTHRDANASKHEGEFKLFPRSRRLRLTDRKEFVRSCKPMLSTSGYPPALLDRFVRETDRGSLAKSISLRPI